MTRFEVFFEIRREMSKPREEKHVVKAVNFVEAQRKVKRAYPDHDITITRCNEIRSA